MYNEGHVIHYIKEQSSCAVIPTVYNDISNDEEDDEFFDLHDAIETNAKTSMRRGRRIMASKFVLNVRDCQEGGRYHLKAEVRASMKLLIRNVTATLSVESGSVLDASCTCVQKTMARCAHIVALLLHVSEHVKKHGNQGTY